MSQAILNCSIYLNFTGTAYNHYCTSTYLELYEVYSTLEKANHLNGELYHSSVICLVFCPLHLSCPFLQKDTENIINIHQTTTSIKLGIIHYCLIYFYKRDEKYSLQLSKNYQKIDGFFLIMHYSIRSNAAELIYHTAKWERLLNSS